jgi:hypothetical protein
MRRARSCRQWLWVLAVGLSLTCISPLDAALFTLTPRDRDEAVRIGRRSVINEDWGGEWRVEGGGAGQLVTVMTPFYRLALAARNQAFQEGKLVFWATLRGTRADFARFYAPALVAHQLEIKALFTQNERTALRGEDGQYTAHCMYVFPVEGVDPRGTVTLLVRDADEKQVAKFTVDLSVMR